MGIKARRGLLLVAIMSVVGALLVSVGVTSPKEAEASFCDQPFTAETTTPEVGAAVASGQTFDNSSSISIPDATSAAASPANPYPSEINVQGLSETISDVNVTLNGYSHGFPDDVAVQVVSPTGKSVLLMSDVGGPPPFTKDGCYGITDINLTLDDEAANSLPDDTQLNLTTGTYKPTKGTTPPPTSGWTDKPVPNSWPTPAPDLTVSGSQLSSFDDTAPNGTWKLYVIDDTPGGVGTFARGWSLELNNTTVTTPLETSITSGPDEGSSTTSNSPTFEFSSNKEGSTFQCQLNKDGAVVEPFAACTPPKSYSTLSPGNYKFEVKATDSAGIVDQTPASRNWSISSVDNPPKVMGTSPANGATLIAPGVNVTATFSEAMDASSTDGDLSTINGTTFKLVRLNADGTTTRVTATVSYAAATKKAKLDPASNLSSRRTYKATVTSGTQDLAGNALDQNPKIVGNQSKSWKFTVQ
jgi:subtilisin-like proprotein convertase family protein